MSSKKTEDTFLEERLKRYDAWLDNDKISFSSRVIPVTESLAAEKWVLPTEQALAILKTAASFAVQPCECRTHYHRCDNPIEVCFLLNQIADTYVAKGLARRVSLTEAADILALANIYGLVHLSLYMPDHHVYALCSCCSCCCHDLQLVQRYGRSDLMVHSNFMADTDEVGCLQCGACVDRCPFDARQMVNTGIEYIAEKCAGCGLCVTTCPADAITMVHRK